MKVVVKMGSKDRWDALPYISFDNAVPVKSLNIKGKTKKKSKVKPRATEMVSQPNVMTEPRAK